MTMISTRAGAQQHLTNDHFAAFAKWIKGASERRRKRRDMYAFERLPDHLLRDIGFERIA